MKRFLIALFVCLMPFSARAYVDPYELWRSLLYPANLTVTQVTSAVARNFHLVDI